MNYWQNRYENLLDYITKECSVEFVISCIEHLNEIREQSYTEKAMQAEEEYRLRCEAEEFGGD